MSPRALTRLTLRAKRSPRIQLAKKRGCLDTNHCVTLRVLGKDFYPSVFGNSNFATCENLTAATAAGVHIDISVHRKPHRLWTSRVKRPMKSRSVPDQPRDTSASKTSMRAPKRTMET